MFILSYQLRIKLTILILKTENTHQNLEYISPFFPIFIYFMLTTIIIKSDPLNHGKKFLILVLYFLF